VGTPKEKPGTHPQGGSPKDKSQAFRRPAYALLSYGVASRRQEKETQKLNTEIYIGMNNTIKNLALLVEIMKFRSKSKMKKPPPEGRWGPGHWVGES